MNCIEKLDDLKQWITKNESRIKGGYWQTDVKKGSPEAISLMELSEKNKVSFSEQCYRIKTNIDSNPSCLYCKSPVTYRNFVHGYSTTCPSYGCITKLSAEKKKQRHTEYVKTSLRSKNIDLVSETSINEAPSILKFPCGHENTIWLKNGRIKNDFECPICYPTSISSPERELRSFIESLGFEVDSQKRMSPSQKRLDLYVPEKSLAIEYCGLMFHSYGKDNWGAIDNLDKEDRNIHVDKMKYVRESMKGKLLTIFEDEYINKKSLVLSIIKSSLGVYDRKIHARKCSISLIDFKTYSDFLESNHIQGTVNSPIRYGLFYEDDLVSVMGVGSSRFTKDKYELHRFCTLINTVVNGGLSKMWAKFVKDYNPSEVVSYADARYFTGSSYENLGMVYVELTPPNYFYLKKHPLKRESRHKFQKHKLSSVLNTYDSNKSEAQNCFDNGYRRIWDCGNFKYMWTSKNNILNKTQQHIRLNS